ncbi:TPA: heterodisulfide reductase, partial [bacterium]|nr:heterodisulfide reductase [bacterium]
MINLTINDQKVEVENGVMILEAIKALRIDIPTLCYHKALSPYGACRLCIVEISAGKRPWIATSCTYPAEEGLVVQTHSERVLKSRRMIVELLLARCPDSQYLKDLAKELGVAKVRLRPRNEDCILCGLCVRMCNERMGISAVSFTNRGLKRKIIPPFDMLSDICQACGACASVCPTGKIKIEEISKNKPVSLLSEFDEGLKQRSPIYIPYPQAVPNWAAIDKDYCVHMLKDKCGICEKVCEAGAINYEQKEERVDLNVGSIILAPGFDKFNSKLKYTYGYGRYKNVVTSLEFERILSASGPFAGHIQRLSDGKEPKRIAWIQCVGSRDCQVDGQYCSSVCCTYAIKEAIIAKEHARDGLEATIFYMDIRTYGKGFEEYYNRAKDEYGVRFIKGRVSDVREIGDTHNLVLRYTSESGKIFEDEFDLVVLSIG